MIWNAILALHSEVPVPTQNQKKITSRLLHISIFNICEKPLKDLCCLSQIQSKQNLSLAIFFPLSSVLFREIAMAAKTNGNFVGGVCN